MITINLDYAASGFGYNPSSIHKGGQIAQQRIQSAKQHIASTLGCSPAEIFFTSGGSESNNWALKGAAFANHKRGRHIITTQIEHPSVLESCRFLEQCGFRVTYLPVDTCGYVRPDAFYNAFDNDTIIVSIAALNHELGTWQSLRPYQVYARSQGAIFHSDCVQAAANNWTSFTNALLFSDLVSISGHKFGVPRGIGVLYVRDGTQIEPLIHGGHQQSGLRAGTEPTELILQLATSLDVRAIQDQVAIGCDVHLRHLRDQLYQYITAALPDTKLNGAPLDSRASNNLNLCFPGVDGEALTLALSSCGVYVSRGSACSSGEYAPSPVLKAIGMSDEDAMSSIRITLPPNIDQDEINIAADHIVECVKQIRQMSNGSSRP